MKFRNVRTAVTYFFFQAEDGIRDLTVTGVQTCALPISTRSRTSAARSWRISPAPTPTSSGAPWRRHAGSSRSSASRSVSLPGRDRLLKGLQVKHLFGPRDPRGCGQGRVGADDPDRLLKLLGRDEPVGEIARARGLEPKRELVRRAYRTAREPRRELLGAGLTDPLLGGEQRAGERREVGVRRAPVCANEDGGAHGLHAEGLGDRLGVRKSASSVARPSSRRRVAIGSGTSAAWISPESIAPRRPRPPRLMRWSWAMLTPTRASSQPNQASSGAPGVVTPTRSPPRLSTDRTAPICPEATSTANGGAAVRPNTRRAVWPGARGPKRSNASSVVAVRSTWPCASASAAPDSARVVRTVTSNPSRAK